MIIQTIALLNVSQKQDTHVFQIIHAPLSVTVEIVNWIQERIVMEQITAHLNANQKLGTHVPITFVSVVEIVFYK